MLDYNIAFIILVLSGGNGVKSSSVTLTYYSFYHVYHAGFISNIVVGRNAIISLCLPGSLSVGWSALAKLIKEHNLYASSVLARKGLHILTTHRVKSNKDED